jgi:hypothetical protein
VDAATDFRKLGFIEYNGELKINNALTTIVLHLKCPYACSADDGRLTRCSAQALLHWPSRRPRPPKRLLPTSPPSVATSPVESASPVRRPKTGDREASDRSHDPSPDTPFKVCAHSIVPRTINRLSTAFWATILRSALPCGQSVAAGGRVARHSSRTPWMLSLIV